MNTKFRKLGGAYLFPVVARHPDGKPYTRQYIIFIEAEELARVAFDVLFGIKYEPNPDDPKNPPSLPF